MITPGITSSKSDWRKRSAIRTPAADTYEGTYAFT